MLSRLANKRQLSPVCSPSIWRHVHSPAAAAAMNIERRHPAFEDLSAALKPLPAFPTTGRDVRVLYEPKDFYETLLYRIARAERRIFIASLYVGKSETELIEALHSALSTNPLLKVDILLDYLRSTRESPQPSSASLVASLCAAFPDRVNFSLWHTPELSGWAKRLVPRRLNEGWGLQHMKMYGFDDTLLISGANLSNDYFTNRQDRYIEFLNNPPLSNYFAQLHRTGCDFSHVVKATDTTSKYPNIDISWSHQFLPSTLKEPRSIPEYKARAQAAFEELTALWASKPIDSLRSSSTASTKRGPVRYDTIARPVLQMGPLGVKQETELVVPSIFRTGNSLATAPGGDRTTLYWTSGYFSVQPAYLKRVLDSKASVRIVTASPQANGFLNSKGISKYVPPAYTPLTREFYEESKRQAQKRRKEPHVDIREWRRKDWTYHAKGIWLTPALSSNIRSRLNISPLQDPDEQDEECYQNHEMAPWLTLVGSSNYGQRSATRDLEANILITTSSPELREDLKDEILQLREYAVDAVNDRLFERKDRRVPWGVKYAAKVIESML